MTAVAREQRPALLRELIGRGVSRWWQVLDEPEGPLNISDVDWVVVQRLVAGRPVRSDPASRRVAIAILDHRRCKGPEIARRLRIDERSVTRLRARLVVGQPDPLLALLVFYPEVAA